MANATATHSAPTRPTPAGSRQRRMVALISYLAPNPGMSPAPLEGVKYLHANRPLPRSPVFYEPSICILAQGRKRGYLGDETFVYDAQQYLVLSVPLPFEVETEASEAEPLLGLALNVDLAVLAEMLMAIDQAGHHMPAAPKGIFATPLDDALGDAVLRLLEILAGPEIERRLLGPGILREIYYRVLTGAQGGALRAALAHHSQFGKVAKALRRIHQEFDGDLDVAALASEAGMSPAAFHAHFKAVTQTSPIQYLKTTRLHRARLIMVQEGANAAVAAVRVGYESPSQFSREFKRLFGRSPVEEARFMKNLLAVPPVMRRTDQAFPTAP
ncbi:AraC family transcriptional regulator [Dongia mobilis]|uniref:AraC family transcriptional regulator n=1 Tax=Dongia mobilis TaxID=578943 RepID=A0A4R6WRH9_9PROT|nr:AraC family transcriptional regulator [Dongia mobilis]TDQ82436.1 AraC family transcriptional regulator [Dongia mobilis]